MRYASEDLVNEHEGVLTGLSILEKMVDGPGGGSAADPKDYMEIVDFFKLFADKCHHGKEEGLLFPEMEKAGIPKDGGPIGQMLLEHAEGRKYVAGMAAAATAVPFRIAAFADSAKNYIRLLRAHIEKENKVLFPMGDRKIPQSVQASLLEAFERHEEEVMGPGTHEKLHAMLAAFGLKYLNEGEQK